MLNRRHLLGLFAALLAAPSFAADLTPAQKDQIDQAVAQALQRSGSPSASIAVINDGQIAYIKAYGDARIDGHVPAAPSMRYAIGSISKQFTASAVLMLVEEGKLSLDDPVARWYPNVTAADRITIRHLLSHTSGLADFWPQDYVMPPMRKDVDPDVLIAEWATKPLEFQPGEKWEYSNTGYVIAGRIVEKVSGKPLFAFLKERIFTPLNMTSVADFDDENVRFPPDALGYRQTAWAPPRPALPEGSGWMLGAGMLAMTAEDLAKWDLSLMRRSLLKPASYDLLYAPTKLNNGQETGYSLGLQVRRAPQMTLGHTGEVSGFISANTVWPAEGRAVVALTNIEASNGASRIVNGVGRLLSGAAAPTPPPPPGATPPPPPVPGSETADVITVRDMLIGLQRGGVDRSRLTANLFAFIDEDALTDFRASLAPLPPLTTVSQAGSNRRGGMTARSYIAMFGNTVVSVSTYWTDDGKLEQFLVSKPG